MMTVAGLHRSSLTFTVCLPVLGLLSGSPLLRTASLVLMGTVVYGAMTLYRRPVPLRTWVVHGLTLAGLVSALALMRRATIDAGLIIVMLGIFNRFLLRRSQRDDLIIVGSSAVLLAAATVVTPGFTFALLIAAFVPSALWAMLTASILGLARGGGHPQVTWAGLAKRPAPPLGASLVGWGLVLMLAGYLAVSFLPRFRFGHLLSPGGLVSFAGAGSEMRLETGGVSTRGGRAVSLQVKAPDAQGLRGLYARLYVLDSYDGQGFFDSKEQPKPFTLEPPSTSKPPIEVRLRRLAPRGEPHPVAAIGWSAPNPVVLSRIGVRPGGSWVTSLPPSHLELRYETWLSASAQIQETGRIRGQADRERFLALPGTLDPRLTALAQEITAGAATPKARLERILGHFSQGFRYTVGPMPGESKDPLVRFLFEAREGHCELYAGAVAVLLRAAGIPARVAAGYYGGWYNRRSGYLELGSEDAHAWVETFIDGRWVWVDATPADERARRSHKRFAWVRDLWDALEGLWFVYVVDFDEQRRQRLVARLTDGVQSGSEAMAGWLNGGGAISGRFGPGGPGAPMGGAAVVAAAVAILAWLFRRPSLGRLGQKLRRRLGGEKAPGLPLGVLVAHQPRERREAARRLVHMYEARRFGPPERAPSVREIRTALRDFERQPRAGKTSA